MSRVLYLGPILNRNRDVIVARCRERLEAGRGHEFLYLAATRPLLDAVTSRLLEGLPGALAPPNVFLLSGFSRRLVAEARDIETGQPLPAFAAIDGDQRPVQRPLLARVVSRLAESGRLPAFSPLARTDGLVDALANLISEIQRAGLTAAEFRKAVVTGRDALHAESKPAYQLRRDYDADVATVYEHFERLLLENRLTDGNTDSLRALAVARGELDGRPVKVPFLTGIRLLILDGFFDLLPVYQELVSSLVKLVPEVIVNLNHDDSNVNAFEAHRDVVERFASLPGFTVVRTAETLDVADELVALRRKLFAGDADAPEPPVGKGGNDGPAPEPDSVEARPNGRIVELKAADRLREVRGVAKEIKRLSIDLGTLPDRIAVCFRQRDAYEPLIREAFQDEGIPLASGERRSVLELPAVRAAMKVLDAAAANRSAAGPEIGVGHLVALAKSDYLGIEPDRPVVERTTPVKAAPAAAMQLSLPWDEPVVSNPAEFPTVSRFAAASAAIDISADELESAVAHVGSELHLGDWLARARQLIAGHLSPESQAALAGLSKEEDDDTLDPDVQEDLDDHASEDVGADEPAVSRSQRARPRLDMPASVLRRASGLVEALGAAVLSIPHRAPADEMAAAFRGALETLGFRKRLVDAAKASLGSAEALRLSAIDLRAAESLDRAIDAVVEGVERTADMTGGVDDVTRAEFRSDLERALAANSVAVTQGVQGGVQLLGLSDTRGLAFVAVFVLGLVEGELPDRARNDWIYPQSSRSIYREGLELKLEDLSPEHALQKEEHAFYQAVCRATERLYLCHPATVNEAEVRESAFLDDVRRAAGPISLLEVPSGFDGSGAIEASTPAELARGVVLLEAAELSEEPGAAALARLARGGEFPALSHEAERRISIERRRERGGFDEFDGLVSREDLRRLVKLGYAARRFSATDLREYGNCGFRFFARDVLGLEARIEAALDLQSLDSGNLLHEVLQRFFTLHAGTDVTTADRDVLVSDLEECARMVFDDFERRMPPLNRSVWNIERRTLGIRLEQFLDAEVSLQRSLSVHRAVERRVEAGFGVNRREGDAFTVDKPLEVPGRGRSIQIVGRVDRIDRSADGSLLAYDYKSGGAPAIVDMKEGRDFQLGIYLEAVSKLFASDGETAVGGVYLTLKDERSRVRTVVANTLAPPGKTLAGSRRVNLDENEFASIRTRILENIANAVERIEDGDFRVAPSKFPDACKYCDYRSVCRVDGYRFRQKLRVDGVPPTLPLTIPKRRRP